MMMGFRKFRGARYLAVLVVATVALLANASIALRYENNHTASGILDSFFDISAATTVTLQVKAPSSGSVASAILKSDGGDYEAVDQISRSNGRCGSKSVFLEDNTNT